MVNSLGLENWISVETEGYADLERGWYTLVGIKFTMTFIIILASKGPVRFLSAYWYKCRASSRVRSAAKQITHKDAKKVMIGPEFRIVLGFAENLSVIFTVMMYSSAIPALYPLVFLILTFNYLSEKYALINHYSKP